MCPPGIGIGISRHEILTKIRAVFINNAIRAGLAALVVCAGVVKVAIEADVQIGAAVLALVTATDFVGDGDFFLAFVANHQEPFTLARAMRQICH